MKYVVIVGCGQTGRNLALELSQSHNVVVIDKDKQALDVLGESFNGKTVVGDALNVEILESAGIQEAHALILLTGNDNFNLVIGKVARRKYGVEKVVLQVYEVKKKKLFSEEGLIIVNRTYLLVEVFKKCIL
ncbi:MAG: TrkA family potassium uptake protein [Candidatus Omnitrophica bacterium]|jgi:trk system potassium uptake protein TrkA|nr:TrkA family potassium uptake protein [Candidatus Omnitrophota bacterium]